MSQGLEYNYAKRKGPAEECLPSPRFVLGGEELCQLEAGRDPP